MWQLDWGQKPDTNDINNAKNPAHIDTTNIDYTYLLHWGEHCVECAIPDCYKVCSLYEARKDKKCARFKYGIYSNPKFHGLYRYGADISFKRWAKLESEFEFGACKINKIKWLDQIDRTLQIFVNFFGALLEPINKKRRINGLYFYLRRHFIKRFTTLDKDKNTFNEFIINAYNPSEDDVLIVIECEQESLCFRDAITITPGENLYKINYDSMNIDLSKRNGRIRLYPDNNVECRLIFSWLDFVKYGSNENRKIQETPVNTDSSSHHTANKIKCVVWDLDNTVWDGILGEVGSEGIKVFPYITELMHSLDERGIIQSVASKNDHDHAWETLKKTGLDKYLLHPEINWKPKSENIKNIADQLNINVDTFAFMDDSPFERAQVENELPSIRTYDPAKLDDIFTWPEFNVTVSAESKNRRSSYQEEIQRKTSSNAVDNYDSFLRQCNMQAVVFRPTEQKEVFRCLELLQRSNQLNLTTHRYEQDEFITTIEKPSILSYAINVSDRFGDYGIVGITIIDISQQIPVLVDFVLSCRVAQKKVEQSLFSWLARNLSERGYSKMHANFLPTERNHILLDVMMDSGFSEIAKDSNSIKLELDLMSVIPDSDIVKIEEPK